MCCMRPSASACSLVCNSGANRGPRCCTRRVASRPYWIACTVAQPTAPISVIEWHPVKTASFLSTQSLAETAHDTNADVAHDINAEGLKCRSNDFSCTARPTLRMRRVHCSPVHLPHRALGRLAQTGRVAPLSPVVERPLAQRRPLAAHLLCGRTALRGRTPTFCLTKDNIGALSVSAALCACNSGLHSSAARQAPALLETAVALLVVFSLPARGVANGSGGQSVRRRRGSRLYMR